MGWRGGALENKGGGMNDVRVGCITEDNTDQYEGDTQKIQTGGITKVDICCRGKGGQKGVEKIRPLFFSQPFSPRKKLRGVLFLVVVVLADGRCFRI